MLGHFRKGETLVVSKLDRLGRDAIGVLPTVRQFGQRLVWKRVLYQREMGPKINSACPCPPPGVVARTQVGGTVVALLSCAQPP